MSETTPLCSVTVESVVPGDPIPYKGHFKKPQAKTRETMAALLGYLIENTPPGGSFALVSRHVLQCDLGITPARLRNVKLALARAGYIRAVACFREDGGQRESAYQVTEQGRTFLREYREGVGASNPPHRANRSKAPRACGDTSPRPSAR